MVKMGLHRTIFAKLLKLDSIPVRTRIRHAEWQAIRDELCRSGNGRDLREETKKFLAHPELQDVLFGPGSQGMPPHLGLQS
jgi:hypothetical protein